MVGKSAAMVVLVGIVLAWVWAGCSDSTTQGPNWVHATITQPADGQTITDSLLRVLVDVTTNCGCSSEVKFYVDSTFIITDFVPAFSCDIDIRQFSRGPHRIIADGIVVGKAEGRDTITVNFQPATE